MRPRLRRVAIFGHTGRPAVRRAAAALARRLARRGCEVRLERSLATAMGRAGEPAERLGAWCQLLVTLGGDGSVLAGGRALAGRRGLLLGVNFGGLGFLAAAEQHELDRAVDAALAGTWPVAAHPLLRARVLRRGRAVAHGHGMNDAVVRGAALQEVIRRFYRYSCEYAMGVEDQKTVQRVELLMKDLGIGTSDRQVAVAAARAAEEAAGTVRPSARQAAISRVVSRASQASKRCHREGRRSEAKPAVADALVRGGEDFVFGVMAARS